MLSSAERWGGGSDERPYLPRAVSVLAAGDGQLSFVIEAVGPGTERLAELTDGDGLRILGPLGNGFSAPGDGVRAIVCGGGIGVAPLAMLQQQLIADGSDVTGLLGFRDGAHAAGAEFIVGAQVATDDGSVGHGGLVTELLLEELGRDANAVIYACGPPQMLDAVRAISVESRVPAQLALEAPMACGYGACYGCVVKAADGTFRRSCVDGPVVGADELAADWLAVGGPQ
jgi:NAD(P)H-flavin reductase